MRVCWWMREPTAEPRIRAQVVEQGIHFQIDQPAGPVLISLLEPLERFVLFA